ncbi:MAG: nucleotidyltransferase domain-containing protein, partial [Deltaproteobacteria bacterium]|nr:nucleotidyltransferase domain-containing protein [Deltaproteobacteria bacterium]
MGIDESLTNEIVRRILTVARPDKIILFGSAASSLMTSDSDIDLLVVEHHIADRREEYVRIR